MVLFSDKHIWWITILTCSLHNGMQNIIVVMPWCSVTGSVVPARSKNHCTFIIIMKMKTLYSIEMPETTHPTTQHHISEDLNLQQPHCKTFKSCKCTHSTYEITEKIVMDYDTHQRLGRSMLLLKNNYYITYNFFSWHQIVLQFLHFSFQVFTFFLDSFSTPFLEEKQKGQTSVVPLQLQQ